MITESNALLTGYCELTLFVIETAQNEINSRKEELRKRNAVKWKGVRFAHFLLKDNNINGSIPKTHDSRLVDSILL